MGFDTMILATNPASPALPGILSHPGIAGLSLAIAWEGVEKSQGQYDFSKFDAGLKVARAAGKQFAPRVRGGAHTPAFRMGRTYTTTTPGGTQTVPVPVDTDGVTNRIWLTGFRSLCHALDGWVKINLHPTDGPVHLTWPGGASAEIWIDDAMLKLQGATLSSVTNAHETVAHAAASVMTTPLPIELSISGLVAGPNLTELQAGIYAAMRTINVARPMMTQRNGFNDGAQTGKWKEGNTQPPRHGLQMQKSHHPDGSPYDWPKVFSKAGVSFSGMAGRGFLECYDTSCVGPGSSELFAEAAAAA